MIRMLKNLSSSAILAAIGLWLSCWTGPISNLTVDARRANESDSVQTVPRDAIVTISQRIDELVAKKLLANGQRRNDQSTDEVFLRRAYLNIVGRIPTLDESHRFRAGPVAAADPHQAAGHGADALAGGAAPAGCRAGDMGQCRTGSPAHHQGALGPGGGPWLL